MPKWQSGFWISMLNTFKRFWISRILRGSVLSTFNKLLNFSNFARVNVNYTSMDFWVSRILWGSVLSTFNRILNFSNFARVCVEYFQRYLNPLQERDGGRDLGTCHRGLFINCTDLIHLHRESIVYTEEMFYLIVSMNEKLFQLASVHLNFITH